MSVALFDLLSPSMARLPMTEGTLPSMLMLRFLVVEDQPLDTWGGFHLAQNLVSQVGRDLFIFDHDIQGFN
jgi:hypothetical protein